MKLSLLFICLLLASCAAPVTSQAPIDKMALQNERLYQKEQVIVHSVELIKRVYPSSYKLLKTANDYCQTNMRFAIGASLWFGTRDKEMRELQKNIGMSNNLIVIDVYPDSNAAAGGLMAGDIIREIDYYKMSSPPSRSGLLDYLAKNINKEFINLKIDRAGSQQIIKLPREKICNYDVGIDEEDDTINAWTNGKDIVLNGGIIRVANDNDIAFILAHEIAHNIMGHRTKKIANMLSGAVLDGLVMLATGYNTQASFAQYGALAYSQKFENEADYVGVYLLAKAGFKIDDVADFWRKIAIDHKSSINERFLATHPSSPERYINIENAVKEVKEKIMLGEELKPTLK